jgi:hypothetical protein
MRVAHDHHSPRTAAQLKLPPSFLPPPLPLPTHTPTHTSSHSSTAPWSTAGAWGSGRGTARWPPCHTRQGPGSCRPPWTRSTPTPTWWASATGASPSSGCVCVCVSCCVWEGGRVQKGRLVRRLGGTTPLLGPSTHSDYIPSMRMCACTLCSPPTARGPARRAQPCGAGDARLDPRGHRLQSGASREGRGWFNSVV